MPEIKIKPESMNLVTTGLAALYSAYISCGKTEHSDFEFTEAVSEFLDGGDGLDSNLSAFIEDCDKLSVFFYRLLGSNWIRGITCTEAHVFGVAWAANTLIACVEHGDWMKGWDTPNVERCIEAAARAMDLAEVMWELEDFALPHSTDSRELRDEFMRAFKIMDKERKEYEERLIVKKKKIGSMEKLTPTGKVIFDDRR